MQLKQCYLTVAYIQRNIPKVLAQTLNIQPLQARQRKLKQLPCAHSHFIRIMNKWTPRTTVTTSKPVEKDAVLFLERLIT